MQEYDIEKSFDGINFSTAGVVAYKPAAGSGSGSAFGSMSGSSNDYSYTDPGTGGIHPLIYYRIKRVDTDGQLAYSGVVLVKMSLHTALTVTPNPAAGTATVSFISDHDASMSVRLVDLTGHSVWQKQYPAATGMNTLALDHLQELPNGMYVLQVYDGTDHEQVKMLIRH